jgi:type I restriction enzyme S subunit
MMSELNNIPNIRFPLFKQYWVENKLGEVASCKVTNSFSRENLNYENGDVKNIHYGDIHTKFQTLFNIDNEIVPFINSNISIDRISEENYCVLGDLVFADASEDLNDVGKSIEIVNTGNQKLLSGLHTILVRPNTNIFYQGFLGYLFKSNSVRLQIQKESQGSKVLSISGGRLLNTNICYPSLAEQQKIASFLTTVDEKFQALKKKKALLEQYKKGVMQKIFSQELRFKDENGIDFPDWEEKKLGEVCEKKSSNISANKIEDNFGDYIIYGASGILKKVDFYEEENDYVSIIKDGAGVGRIVYCKGKSSVLGTMEIIKPKIELNTYFLYCLLENVDFTKYVTGSTIPHIYFKDYKNEKCGIPFFNEQTKIANFLSSIDDKINHTQSQIEKMEDWKKGLLQKMFV